jgi:hypothetical protein
MPTAALDGAMPVDDDVSCRATCGNSLAILAPVLDEGAIVPLSMECSSPIAEPLALVTEAGAINWSRLPWGG